MHEFCLKLSFSNKPIAYLKSSEDENVLFATKMVFFEEVVKFIKCIYFEA